jgi:hypothetical protein
LETTFHIILLLYPLPACKIIVSPIVTFEATEFGLLSLMNGKVELVLTVHMYSPESSLPNEVTIAVLV